MEAADAGAAGKSLPLFCPEPATMAGCITIISSTFAHRFTEEDFKVGMRRCFVAVGLACGPDGTYATSPEQMHFVVSRHSKSYAEAADVEFEERYDFADDENASASVGALAVGCAGL